MSSEGLDHWLERISAMHPSDIELGLERIALVWDRLKPEGTIAGHVVTYAGTNGKGSTLAMTERLLCDAGLKVVAYTSPHLLRFTERLRIQGVESQAALWLQAFERVEAARGSTSLTYFEYTTLAALCIIAQVKPDVALLEVGLGGRLDAVNIVDPDLAVITPVDMDHADWLGKDRETIGREKAGILREGIPLVLADPVPPESVLAAARTLRCRIYRFGVEHRFIASQSEDITVWQGSTLPDSDPGLSCQLASIDSCVLPPENVSAALQVAALLGALPGEHCQPVTPWVNLALRGRLEQVSHAPDILLDVGHNPHAARYLGRWLADHPVSGKNIALFSALADKDIESVVSAMAPVMEIWHVAPLDVPRAATLPRLVQAVERAGRVAVQHDTVDSALHAILPELCAADRLLIFGSFYTVAEALPVLRASALAVGE